MENEWNQTTTKNEKEKEKKNRISNPNNETKKMNLSCVSFDECYENLIQCWMNNGSAQ